MDVLQNVVCIENTKTQQCTHCLHMNGSCSMDLRRDYLQRLSNWTEAWHSELGFLECVVKRATLSKTAQLCLCKVVFLCECLKLCWCTRAASLNHLCLGCVQPSTPVQISISSYCSPPLSKWPCVCKRFPGSLMILKILKKAYTFKSPNWYCSSSFINFSHDKSRSLQPPYIFICFQWKSLISDHYTFKGEWIDISLYGDHQWHLVVKI